jgi:hypothetical protein
VDELFSCRNCVHNCGQSLLIGRGAGFCVKHDSVLLRPERTTCKYLHRKDLPRFVVDEGIRQHAAEFAGFSGLADMVDLQPVKRLPYSEKLAWEQRQFDPINQSLAQYHKTRPAWIVLQAMSGGIDGRRSLAHASLVRRYMDHCGTWRSSYRFVLVLIQSLPFTPQFSDSDLYGNDSKIGQELRDEAVWDVFFTKLSGVQEYGFHSGIEPLMWASDQLDDALVALDWPGLRDELRTKAPEWMEMVIQHASDEGAFFPPQPEPEEAEAVESY